jgi:serine/threonine protein kinase/Tol biopolymer transport system component
MIGRMLGRYRIESKLGEGGMGVVYLARDTQLDRDVAIKILPQDRVSDPLRRQRFVQEAKAASALNHPGIVTIHDISADEGVDFIVMEYVAGKTLDLVIPAKGLGTRRALVYGTAIADALSRAHEVGIVHRDLKPSNIIVSDQDAIKVLDFGLAKLLEPASDQSRLQTAAFTDPGFVVGTAAYMSPEQARGDRLDARSDIFSFGTVLYEMVTGRRPFEADSRVGVLAKILNDDPAPPSQLAAVPQDVERAILRCLRKDPARRYQTMADLKVALEDLAIESATEARAQQPAVRARRRWPWLAPVMTTIVLVAAWLALQYGRAPQPTTPLRAEPLTSLSGITRTPSFSPDANQVAFAWTGPEGNNSDIYVQQIGAATHLRLTSDPGNDYAPIWSPDGRWIAFLRGEDGRVNEVRLVPPLTGPERKVTEIQPRGFLRPLTLSWCPDSSCLVVIDSLGPDMPDVLFVVSLQSGQKRQLTTPGRQGYADSDPAISPDGKWLVFRRDVAPFAGGLHLQALQSDLTVTGEPRSLTPVDLYAYNPRWMPSSDEIVFSARSALWRLRIPDGGPPERLPFVGEDGLSPIVSASRADGSARLAYVRSYTDANIWRVDVPAAGAPATAPPVLAISSTRRDAIAHIAPDGRRVTFTSARSGESEVWRADISGAGAVQLTSMRTVPGWPRWSPDGELIAFHTNGVDGNGDIFVVPAEGGQPRNLTSHTATDTFPSFSRDSRWIYFSSTRSGVPTIWKVPAAGGDAVRVSPGVGMMAIESPDGAYVYYTESRSTNAPAALWRQPVTGGTPIKIADGISATAFDVVQNGIYNLARVSGQGQLQYLDLATRKVVTVAANLGSMDAGVDATPDGRTILFTRVDSSVNDVMLVDDFR